MSSNYANSFFGCLGVLCEHYGMTMSLTPEALRESITEPEDLSGVESALSEAGFTVARLPLALENLQATSQSFPLLAKRRDGGFVLIVGISVVNKERNCSPGLGSRIEDSSVALRSARTRKARNGSVSATLTS